MVSLGFERQAILRDYRYSPNPAETVRLNGMGFAHRTQRTPAEYAGISIFSYLEGQAPESVLEVLALSGAPFHLVHSGSHFDFWKTSFGSGLERPRARPVERNISYDHLRSVLDEYALDLNPERIVGVKQGRERFAHEAFADVEPLQLALWTTEVTEKLLVDHFSHAVGVLRNEQKGANRQDIETTALAIRLLGAMVLADTGGLGEDIRLQRDSVGLDVLMQRAATTFERYFRPIPSDRMRAASTAFEVLRRISYAGFTPQMLIKLYVAAYTRKQRREFGRYDTPLYLTRRIWEYLPVELLPPEQRVVCDMTSGLGSFLIAGHERLGRMQDMQDRSLRGYLHGNDKSDFAARLSGLGLLLSTLEDSWHIDSEDARTWRWIEHARPNIIVGNPPFLGDRKNPNRGSTSREQLADVFLRRALDCIAPNGLLAMIMPRNFGIAQASPTLRQALLETCDVLEFWELPTDVFPDASVRTAVIFARKRTAEAGRSNGPVVVRSVQSNTFDRFEREGIFTRTSLVPDQSVWNENAKPSPSSRNNFRIEYKLIMTEGEWRRIRQHCVELKDRAIVFRGCAVGSEERRREKIKSKTPTQIRFLDGAKAVLPEPFRVDHSVERVAQYPRDFEEPREQHQAILGSEKVIVTHVVEPAWGQQVKVGIERNGSFVSDSFWVAAPSDEGTKENVNNEVIAAVLQWIVSNAWIVEHLRSTGIGAPALRSVPFPRMIEPADRDALTAAVRQIEGAKARGREAPEHATSEIDQVLRRLYGIDDETWMRLAAVAEWGTTSPRTLDPPPNLEAPWYTDGFVECFDPELEMLTLFLTGFDGPQSVAVGPNMPGWLLREGVPFRTTTSLRAREHRKVMHPSELGPFSVMPYAYLEDEDELDAELTGAIHDR